MTKSYSLDLRRRVTRFVEADHSCHEAARHFEVSVAFVVRLMAAYRATGSLAAKPEGGWRYSKLDPHREFLIRRMTEKDDLTMPQLASEVLALAVWMRDLLGGSDNEEGFGQDTRVGGRLIALVGELGIGLHPSAHHLIRRDALQHALAPRIIGTVEALQQDLQIRMAVDRNPQHLPLHAAVEALDHAVGFGRVGPRGPVLHGQLTTGSLEPVRRKA